MIVLDSSALIAVSNDEPERQKFQEIVAAADRCLISSMTHFEVRMVTFGRFVAAGIERLTRWMAVFEPEIVPFDVHQADVAFAAFQIYGKGFHAKARLNFGDCASYALAKSRNVPLLFKGSDFAATDIVAAA